MATPPGAASPPVPWTFVVISIVVAIAVSAVIAYLGLTGHLGAGIPGEKAPGGIISIPFVGLALNAVARKAGWLPP